MPNANADSLFSNYATSTVTTATTNLGQVGGSPTNVTRKGLRFTTGSIAYALTSVDADFSLDTGTAPATVTASLFLGIGGGNSVRINDGSPGGSAGISSPLASLQSQTVSSPNGTPTTLSFAAAGAPILQPNTTYLIIFGTADSVRARWYTANPTNAFPVAESGSGFSAPEYGLYTAGSATSLGSTANSNSGNRIRINGTAVVVPEVGTISLLALGAVSGVGVAVRRRVCTK